MTRSEVESIFDSAKENILSGYQPSLSPEAYLLGGQGAVGKGQLNKIILSEHPDSFFLQINGDNYRCCHPLFDSLKFDEVRYSAETQVFSNVFTERLIEEGSSRHLNIIVEGTMRDSNTVVRTVSFLKSHGYSVKAFAIAAPSEYSSANAIIRYKKECQVQGYGRLIDFVSHDAAVAGLPYSLDRLFDEQLVDEIRLFSLFAEETAAMYFRSKDGWNIDCKPSEKVAACCRQQLIDTNRINSFISALQDLKHPFTHGLDNEIEKCLTSLFSLLDSRKK